MIPAVLATAAVSAAMCAFFAFTRAGHLLLDRPNSRSLHQHPVPRVGGLGIYVGMLAGVGVMALIDSSSLRPALFLVVAALPLVVVGLADDRYSLGAPVRFLVQAATTLALLFSTNWIVETFPVGGLSLPLGLLAWPLTTVAVLWAANLYNFMDGMDGFAAFMTAVGFGTLAAFAAIGGHTDILAAASLPAGAAIGFLLFNVPPARLFMGDSGSVPLGFLAAAISLWGSRRGAWPIAVPVIVFAPFVVDATATLFRRLIRGDRVWEAHRDHVYQRMVLNGMPQPRVLVCEVAYMAASSLLAAVSLWYPVWGAVAALAGVLAIYAALAFAARPRPKASAPF